VNRFFRRDLAGKGVDEEIVEFTQDFIPPFNWQLSSTLKRA